MLPRILSYLAFLSLFVVAFMSGQLISMSGRIFQKEFAHLLAGKPFPVLTESFLSYATSGWPMVAGLIFGAGMFVFLAALDYFPKTSRYVPIAIAFGWNVLLVQLATAIMAYTMAFFELGNSLQK